jgi:hypothetical protein
MQKPPLDPDATDTAPSDSVLTIYDEEHLMTYLRLLDADAQGADWREVARMVLHLDPELESDRARRAFDSHLSRAKWMTEHGYRHLLVWRRVGLKRRHQFARASDASDPTSKQDSEESAIEWHTISYLAGKTANGEISSTPRRGLIAGAGPCRARSTALDHTGFMPAILVIPYFDRLDRGFDFGAVTCPVDRT